MNKKILKNVTYVFVVVFAIVLFYDAKAKVVKAETEDYKVLTTKTIDGEEWTLAKNGGIIQLEIEDNEPLIICACNNIKEIDIAHDGTIYTRDGDNFIFWCNYKISPDGVNYSYNYNGVILAAKCFKYDEEGFVIGFIINDDEELPVLNEEEMKNRIDQTIQMPTSDLTPIVDIPTSEPKKTEKKLTVKKEAGYNCLYEDNDLISKYKLKKSKLTYKMENKKSITVKAVKLVAFTKSKELVYITKKGKAYTINSKGIKKCIKKKAKKLTIVKKFAVKLDEKTL